MEVTNIWNRKLVSRDNIARETSRQKGSQQKIAAFRRIGINKVARITRRIVRSTYGKFEVAARDIRDPCHCPSLSQTRGDNKKSTLGEKERRIGRSVPVEGKTYHVWLGGNSESPCFLPGKRIGKEKRQRNVQGETDTQDPMLVGRGVIFYGSASGASPYPLQDSLD